MDAPLRWRKPRRVFVNSMSDLFHEGVPDAVLDRIFAVMALCPQHTFQVLTKRAERMSLWACGNAVERVQLALKALAYSGKLGERGKRGPLPQVPGWPLPNVWLGVSVEDQERADERIPHLLRVPAAVRFLSCEPLLEAVDLHAARYAHPDGSTIGAVTSWDGGVDWVIVGGESGPGARPFDLAWARSLVAQCKATRVACFVKQLGANPVTNYYGRDGGESAAQCEERTGAEITVAGWDERDGQPPLHTVYQVPLRDPKGGDMAEWPEDLRVREMPAVRR
jgi:protein gp37